ncbi:MAG: hypothetical protein QOH96_203, partial [Blastocatellia bacterium]|nr:hypothetical protein [Blastocatellia bacterium]
SGFAGTSAGTYAEAAEAAPWIGGVVHNVTKIPFAAQPLRRRIVELQTP